MIGSGDIHLRSMAHHVFKNIPCVSGDISNLANRNSTKVSEIFSLGTILTSGTFEENCIVGS